MKTTDDTTILNIPEHFYTLKEAAVALNVKSSKLYKMFGEGFCSGKGETFVMNHKRYISKKAVSDYIKRHICAGVLL